MKANKERSGEAREDYPCHHKNKKSTWSFDPRAAESAIYLSMAALAGNVCAANLPSMTVSFCVAMDEQLRRLCSDALDVGLLNPAGQNDRHIKNPGFSATFFARVPLTVTMRSVYVAVCNVYGVSPLQWLQQ